MRYLILGVLLLAILSCVPPAKQGDLDIIVDFSNEEQQRVINLKDRGDTLQLATYLTAEDVTLRYLAAQSAGSIQAKSLKRPLLDLLNNDPSGEVRAVAAYSLGQYRSGDIQDDLTTSFTLQDTSVYNTPVRGAILEAIGKCGDEGMLELIANVSTYQPEDHHLLLGQVRAIYRFGLRNIYHQSGTQLMLERVTDNAIPDETRLIAAHYLARNPGIDIATGLGMLVGQMERETNNHIRMALAGAITSRGDERYAGNILNRLSKEDDYRVQSNIIRNLAAYNYEVYRDSVLVLLDHENDHLFNLSASLLVNTAQRQDAGLFLQKARNTNVHQRKAQLLGIALSVLPARFINTRRIINDELLAGLTTANSDNDRAAYIRALAHDPLNIQPFIEQGLSSTSNLVQTTAIISIPVLLTNPRTQTVYSRPSSYAQFRELIITELNKILASGDAGAIAAIASVSRNEALGFKDVAGFNLAIRTAMRQLDLPKEYESHKECLQTLAYLEDTSYVIDPPAYNHPIDWSFISDLTDSSRAYIITTKGQIEVQLYRRYAPGSVSNFVNLSQSNFYDGKTIHRVVPNFVIQGGCPRGDGYGSLDYTIRSEFGPLYYNDEGYLGMASAGKDTEGTQWFITHSPTPHLDGRYTIFGKVTGGMETVHKIQPGDIIQDVRILKY